MTTNAASASPTLDQVAERCCKLTLWTVAERHQKVLQTDIRSRGGYARGVDGYLERLADPLISELLETLPAVPLGDRIWAAPIGTLWSTHSSVS